ncbi:glycogen/starch/alpha-glucan phosphorylase [soil metagenome]
MKHPVLVPVEPPVAPAEFSRAVTRNLIRTLALDPSVASERDVYVATAWSVRDELGERWAATRLRHQQAGVKRVYYLSLEFLMGRTLGNALLNLALEGTAEAALDRLGYDLEELERREPDAGLGNGGLGRLAAGYLDSMATLDIPGWGYGIRYEHGIFRQRIEDGAQVEMPDSWLRRGNPWEVPRADRTYTVQFYGGTENWPAEDGSGTTRHAWTGTRDVLAMAYDTPIPGYRNGVVNTLRLWAAKATEEFDLGDFIRGDYVAAVEEKNQSETISKVLYPPDDTGSGKELRLKQQFFFVSATLQDILRRFRDEHDDFADLPSQVQIQLNDTHPALAIPELMRLLMDGEGMAWNPAWEIVRRTFAYTNHTVLPEALEVWGTGLLANLLPRHLELIEEIDRRFRERVVAEFPGDEARVERMAIVSGGGVRMAHLAIVGSHTVNGVADLHARILKERIFPDFDRLQPGKIIGITNGVTQRRWLQLANRGLAALISESIGDGWITDLPRLRELEPFAEEAEFRARWRAVKADNKSRLAALVSRVAGVELDPAMLIDVQVKRIHEYKRQLLNALRVADAYLSLRADPALEPVPRAVLFGGKAAPTYWTAKLIIRLINAIAERVNGDPRTAGILRVGYLPDYRVSQAMRIFPGSDLSEQTSTAGFEASGTGNMKFALNGALTIGTLDGANIEIADAVGRDNMFIFGMTAEEVVALRASGYRPREAYEGSPRLRRTLDWIVSGELSPEEPDRFQFLVDDLLERDPFFTLADFDDYLRAQEEVDAAYRDPERWTRMAILNVARSGYFSSDRSVREYADRIWKL